MRVRELAEWLGATFEGDGDAELSGAAALDMAAPSDLSFAAGRKATEAAAATNAGCLIVPLDWPSPSPKTVIRVKEPRTAFARAMSRFYPTTELTPGIHPSAVIGKDVQIGAMSFVGPNAAIGDGSRLGVSVSIGAGCSIGKRVVLGEGCVLHANVTVYDNVSCQHRLVTEHLGISRLRLVVGFSMGGQQAFHWGALFSDMVDAIAPICGSAWTSPHNFVFLDGVKAALRADAAFKNGWYDAPPETGIRAFGRVYAGWVYSQDFYRDREHTKLGLQSVEDVMRASEARYLQRDANDLLTMLWTWQHADISAHPAFAHDFAGALRRISCRAVVMPSATDLYFRVRDNEIEVAGMLNAELRVIPSTWGHAAGRGLNPEDNVFIDAGLRAALS
jgi:homoserine O-acetyltransferase